MNQATSVGAALNVADDSPLPPQTVRQYYAEMTTDAHKQIARVETQKAKAEKLGLLDMNMEDFRRMVYPGYSD